jgi:cytochrome c-type biogenesis protein
MELTLGAALIAGLVSFLSPCVLPVVPAYLGQLGVIVATSVSPTVVAVGRGGLAPAGAAASATIGTADPIALTAPLPQTAEIATSSPRGTWGRATGWRAIPNAIAFVAGFTVIFTLLGLALSGVLGPLRDNQALIRQIGGVVLIVLGLNLMGILRVGRMANTWRPLARFGGPSGRVGPQRGVLGGLALGAIFAVGWTPCIGPTLGAVLTLALAGPSAQVVALLVAYSLGLGIPFILLALAVDRAPSITRPLVAHGHTIELVGGALVVVIGVALLFDWLGVIARQFSTLWPQV